MPHIKHIENMQRAVDAIAQSPHPTNKVAACIHRSDYTIAKPNAWPTAIENTIGRNTKIGNASGTIHAETACILAAPYTRHADIYITDPPCPNCMKNIAEAGIDNIYIDHKGFDKDFAIRRGHHFENMSMRIGEMAGINIFVINRKEQTITPISKAAQDYKPPHENPVYISAIDKQLPAEHIWKQKIEEAAAIYKGENFALCLADDKDGNTHSINARKHPTIGYTTETLESPRGESGGTPEREMEKSGKYSFTIEPLNRLLMNAARHGLTIRSEYIYMHHCPTARELVNFVGASLSQIQIGQRQESRDEFGPAALKQLSDAGILHVKN